MNNKKKFFATLIIIGIAIILLFVQSRQDISSNEVLPTRDVEGMEGYASIEDFCTDLTASQEFDDTTRAQSFYDECLMSYSL